MDKSIFQQILKSIQQYEYPKFINKLTELI